MISKPHNLNPISKPQLSPIHSRSEKVSAVGKTMQDLIPFFPPNDIAYDQKGNEGSFQKAIKPVDKTYFQMH